MAKRSLKKLTVLLLSVSLIGGEIAAGGCLGTEQETIQIIEDITPQEAFSLIQENQGNPDFVIIDLQGPKTFAHEHIEGAVNLDYHSEAFRDKLNALDKSKAYLIYYSCRCGNVAEKTLGEMATLNFREAYNLSGGLSRWKAEELPTIIEE